jgi:hypothetical protein
MQKPSTIINNKTATFLTTTDRQPCYSSFICVDKKKIQATKEREPDFAPE